MSFLSRSAQILIPLLPLLAVLQSGTQDKNVHDFSRPRSLTERPSTVFLNYSEGGHSTIILVGSDIPVRPEDQIFSLSSENGDRPLGWHELLLKKHVGDYHA